LRDRHNPGLHPVDFGEQHHQGAWSVTERTAAPGRREKVEEELQEYLAIAVYLAIFFGALLNYRRVVLDEAGISYGHYGLSIVEALVMAKIILIGEVLHFGKRQEHQPLLVSALVKSGIFGIFVMLFLVLERVVESLWKGEPLAGKLGAFVARPSVALAHVVLVFLALIPFFLLTEAGRRLGETSLLRVLWYRGGPPPKDRAGDQPRPSP
jgi:hypothetical protein